MPTQSDLTLSASKFDPANITADTHNISDMLEVIGKKGPQWYEVGPEKYQQLRDAGETSLPAPEYLPGAKEAALPSREAGRDIPLRVYAPDDGKPSRGVFLHFHGGGMVLGDHRSQDPFLRTYATTTHLTTISVGYRHAPAHPYPAPIDDCIDAAAYLVEHAVADYGGPLLFIGGESAGACCALLATFSLLRSHPAFKLAGLVLPFGWYDLSLSLPSVVAPKPLRLVDAGMMRRFKEAYVPGLSDAELRTGAVSPLYADLQAWRGRLPPALFLVGTEDPLLDENLLMGVKWMAAGAEAVVKVWAGAPHGFTAFTRTVASEEAWGCMVDFLKEKLEKMEG